MNWLTNFVRPKIQALVRNTRVRESLWEKCTACDQMIFHRELAERLQVCPHCGHHMFFRPMERMSHLFDQGEYEILEFPEGDKIPESYSILSEFALKMVKFEQVDEESEVEDDGRRLS